MKLLWNKDKTASVNESKIREIVIYSESYAKSPIEKFRVKAWFNRNDGFEFGYFETKEEAVKFIQEMNTEKHTEFV